MSAALSVIKRMKGCFFTLPEYGRSVDIRFGMDSLVLIGYLPKRLEIVKKRVGRSSRTMPVHHCKFFGIDPVLIDSCIEERLSALHFELLSRGIRVVRIMRVRRRRG